MSNQHRSPTRDDLGAISRPAPQPLLWRIVLIAVVLIAATGVAIRIWPVFVDTAFGSPAETTQAPDEPQLPGKAVPILDSPHIPVGGADGVHYNSIPPTSGPHFAVPPATGIYDAALPEGLQVHALEHGHVGIQYGPDVAPSVVAALRRIGARYPGDVFVAPCPQLSNQIALTAWGRIDTFDVMDEVRTVRFVEELRGRYDHGWMRR